MTLEQEIMRRVADMPAELQQKLLDYAAALCSTPAKLETDSDLDAEYREMAADTQRENAAHLWAEGLIGDVIADTPNASR